LIGVRARELVFWEGVSYWSGKILTFEKADLPIWPASPTPAMTGQSTTNCLKTTTCQLASLGRAQSNAIDRATLRFDVADLPDDARELMEPRAGIATLRIFLNAVLR
jgi:hypothetical protein